MANPELTQRVREHFERQIAVLQDMLAHMEDLERDFDEPELEELVRRETERGQELDKLQEEMMALLAEWERDTEVSDGERQSIRILAGKIETLAQQAAARFADGAKRVSDRLETVNGQLLEIQRGRSAMRKYGPGGPPQPDNFDRDA